MLLKWAIKSKSVALSFFRSDNSLDIDRNVYLFIFCIYIISAQSGIKNEHFQRKQWWCICRWDLEQKEPCLIIECSIVKGDMKKGFYHDLERLQEKMTIQDLVRLVPGKGFEYKLFTWLYRYRLLTLTVPVMLVTNLSPTKTVQNIHD